MSTEYERLMRQYNVPPGVLSAEQLHLLQQGGIRLDDSDEEDNNDNRRHYGNHTQSYNHNPNYSTTNPKSYNNNHASSTMEIESLRQIYEDKLSMKEKQLAYMQHQVSNREQLFEAEKHRLHTQHQLENEKMLSELRNARAKVVHTQGQIPLIKEALNQVRQMLSGMVSESVYLRLKDFNERQLPPSEWIMVNVWELVYPYKKELEYNKKEVNKLRDQIKIMNDKQHSLLNEVEHYSRLLSSKDDDSKRHALNYQNNRKSMELEIDKLREQTELLREKGSRYDELLRDYQFTKQEKQLVEQKLTYYGKQQQGNSTMGDLSRGGHEQSQRRKVDLLMQDKQYLTKQNIQLIEKNRRLEDRLDRLEAELLNEKNRSQEYLHQLLNLKTDSVSSYEQKISKQLEQMKDKHRHELEMSKNNLVDIYEKQLRFLKQSLEEKQLKLESTQRGLRQKNKEYEQLMIDTRDFQRKFDGDLSQTRIQLKIKTEQSDRIGNIYQETLGNLNAHKHQNDMLREKLNCLKGEYYKSQANNKDEMSGLKAQVAVLRQQLANYDIIEKQMDEAIMTMGNITGNNNPLHHTLNSVPTSNKRRIQQAMSLAQRLQAKQRQHELTLEELQRTKQALEQASSELQIARSLLDKTNQPYSYLVANIQEKQKETMMLRQQNKKIDQSYENIKEEYRELKRQLQEAERDVQRLLLKRQSIQNIQNILVELTRGPTTAGQINGAVQEIRDILGQTAMRQTGHMSKGNDGLNMKSNPQPTNDGPSWFKKLQENKAKGAKY